MVIGLGTVTDLGPGSIPGWGTETCKSRGTAKNKDIK